MFPEILSRQNNEQPHTLNRQETLNKADQLITKLQPHQTLKIWRYPNLSSEEIQSFEAILRNVKIADADDELMVKVNEIATYLFAADKRGGNLSQARDQKLTLVETFGKLFDTLSPENISDHDNAILAMTDMIRDISRRHRDQPEVILNQTALILQQARQLDIEEAVLLHCYYPYIEPLLKQDGPWAKEWNYQPWEEAIKPRLDALMETFKSDEPKNSSLHRAVDASFVWDAFTVSEKYGKIKPQKLIELKNEQGLTPLHTARSAEVAGAFLHMSPLTPSHILATDGKTALHTAKNASIAEALLKADLDLLNQRDNAGNTALHTLDSADAVEHLLQIIDPEEALKVRNNEGKTPLHTAMNVEVAQALLKSAKKAGLNVKELLLIKDQESKTPLHTVKDVFVGDLFLKETTGEDGTLDKQLVQAKDHTGQCAMNDFVGRFGKSRSNLAIPLYQTEIGLPNGWLSWRGGFENNCWFNSCLKFFASSPLFNEMIEKRPPTDPLRKVIEALRENRPIDRSAHKALRKSLANTFAEGHQHDAPEAIMRLAKDYKWEATTEGPFSSLVENQRRQYPQIEGGYEPVGHDAVKYGNQDNFKPWIQVTLDNTIVGDGKKPLDLGELLTRPDPREVYPDEPKNVGNQKFNYRSYPTNLPERMLVYFNRGYVDEKGEEHKAPNPIKLGHDGLITLPLYESIKDDKGNITGYKKVADHKYRIELSMTKLGAGTRSGHWVTEAQTEDGKAYQHSDGNVQKFEGPIGQDGVFLQLKRVTS